MWEKLPDKRSATKGKNSRRSGRLARSPASTYRRAMIDSATTMRSLRRAASTHRIDMLSMTNSESALEPDILLNSPLVSWLRQELQYAWLREKAIRTEIAKVADRDIARLESHMQKLT